MGERGFCEKKYLKGCKSNQKFHRGKIGNNIYCMEENTIHP